MIVLFLDIDGVLNKHEFNPEARSSVTFMRCRGIYMDSAWEDVLRRLELL